MLDGFKKFIMRGNIVDLAVAVAVGAAFTGLVTKFTESVVQPLLSRVGAGKETDVGLLKIPLGGGQFIDLNILLSAGINFIIVAAAIYFLIVLPFNKLKKKSDKEEKKTESPADAQTRLLTEIRDSLAGGRGTSAALDDAVSPQLRK
ncbi:large-conductance mechanosensitive channel protein MscL [Mycolicibacterium sp.]|uniref:large-conductance mechanosensitive channel protein MscL n=1 Tax=Mycolicibacterium sp. TaxID=2320850 RepID=UPI0028A7E1CB|nr:large-conductance mechanosensitive channel protein MscL [Mycolicibacterium sp.]